MLKYELLLKLKDAGFPFKARPKNAVDSYSTMLVNFNGKMFYVPTVEELIEACINIQPIGFEVRRNASGTWVATTDLEKPIGGSGDTPLEAVANLWLALNDSINKK